MSDANTQVVAHEGRIIRIIEQSTPSGKIRETAIRPPGTRIIIHRKSDDHILLSREIRLDIGEDVRLPGGKVRDLLTEWDEIKNSSEINDYIIQAGAKETREESGIDPTDLQIFSVSKSGGPTIEWTLYYLVATEFTVLDHQDLEDDEKINNFWVSIDEAIEICLSGKMKEGRSVAALLQYFHSIGKI